MSEDSTSEAPSPAVPAAPQAARHDAWDWLKVLGIVIVGVVSFRSFVAEAYVIKGQSMVPTFQESDRLLISKIKALDTLERGDVVVFERKHKRLIKRVIGLGGDIVEIQNGIVYVNDEPLEESYAWLDRGSSMPKTEVPLGQLFVLGDHRKSSSDSRAWGPIPAESLLGKAVVRFFPFSGWSFF